MSAHLAVLATLALAILFSPETLVLGLVIASDKKVPRQASFAFALGAILGIAFATGIGVWIAHLPEPERRRPTTTRGPASSCGC